MQKKLRSLISSKPLLEKMAMHDAGNQVLYVSQGLLPTAHRPHFKTNHLHKLSAYLWLTSQGSITLAQTVPNL